MNQLGELAYHIWDIEFGDHTTSLQREHNVLLISGYLESNIGQLNVFLNTDFSLDKEKDIMVPSLEYEEKAIFTQLYLKDYMNKEARKILRNASVSEPSTSDTSSTTTTDGVTDWIELREGDTTIKRSLATSTTKNASARIFQQSANEASSLLKELIAAYNMYGSRPLQVNTSDAGECNGDEINEEVEALTSQLKAYVDQQDESNIDQILKEVNLLIGSSETTGYAKTIPIPKDSETLFIDWSEEFKPKKTPTVLATIRSLSSDDRLIVYSIEGAPSLNGVRLAFSSAVPSDAYSIEVAAFEIGSISVES